MRNAWIVRCVICSVAVFSACSSKAQTPPPAEAQATLAGATQASHAQNAPTDLTMAEGTVLETMDGGNYTYLRMKTASGEVWIAGPKSKIAVGDNLVIPLEMPMQNFHSQSLNRDFPLIYFASQIAHAGEEATALKSAQTAATAAAAPVTEPIAPAPGGITVAKIVTDRKALAGKPVTVRGKVVKFNGGIMDLNWLHIQDGSGDAKDGSNDLTITSKTGTANVGDVVTVTGTVVVDKDFGYGYNYAVLLQDAKISPKQ